LEFEYVDLKVIALDPSAVEKVPEELARQYGVVPLQLTRSESVPRLKVAVATLTHTLLLGLDEIRQISRCHIDIVRGDEEAIQNALNIAYG